VEAWRRTAEWTTRRARAGRAAGRPPGPEGSLAKLSSSIIARRCHDAHTAIAGAHGMLNGPDAAAGGLVAEVLVSTPAMSIAGGTDEIQHNIIGERVLGLPREPDPSKDVPFREVRTNPT
jgi:alkylation response protein AidB-like acyl-CoA dehydrogenase